MCPMLWCRDKFENQSSTMDHIPQCDWLSNAWYWCPQCCRPEHFMGCSKMCVTRGIPGCRRSKSSIGRVMTFLRNFGQRPSMRERNARSCRCFKTCSEGWQGNAQIEGYEIAGTPKMLGEIDDTALFEMARRTQMYCLPPIAEKSARLSHAIMYELESSVNDIPELSASHFTSGTCPGVFGQRDLRPLVPASKTAPSVLSTGITPLPVCDATARGTVASCGCQDTVCTSSDRHSTLEAHFEVFSRAFATRKSDWERLLASMPGLSTVYSKWSTTDLLIVGVETFQRWCQLTSLGFPEYLNLIQNYFVFENVFAFMHLAQVISDMFSPENCSRDFSMEILMWREVLSNQNDKLLLEKIVERLFDPHRLITSPSEVHAFETHYRGETLKELKDCRIMQDCLTFLNGKVDRRQTHGTNPDDLSRVYLCKNL